MTTTIIVPTFNEAANVAELVRRIEAAMQGREHEILFVDDSVDATPERVLEAAATSAHPVRLLHRDEPRHGLSGAVVEGLRLAEGEVCVVMDGDLQHPPELIPALVEAADGADVVVASRRIPGGGDDGLSTGRRVVSHGATLLSKVMFPSRLAACSDPMSGFFAVRRDRIDLDQLRPRGFKILLELLCRRRLAVVEVPLRFGHRLAGQSKADVGQGTRFLAQLAMLRFERIVRFGLLGGLGALANLAIMALLIAVGTGYLAAAIVAAAVTIVGNFLLQERFVFADRLVGQRRRRALRSLGFNTAEAIVRLPVLAFLVEIAGLQSIVAQALTLVVAFAARYAYHAVLVYGVTPPEPLTALPQPDRP